MGQNLVFPVIFVLAIIEIFLLNSWNPWYFTLGIPLFRRKYGDSNVPVLARWPHAGQLECMYNAKGVRFPPIAFKELSATEYAFRHKWFAFGRRISLPVMRGLLRWDIKTGEVIVVGYINWYTVLFLGWCTMLFLGPGGGSVALISVLAWLFFTTAVGLLYAVQSRCYDEVGKLARQAWRTGVITTDTLG